MQKRTPGPHCRQAVLSLHAADLYWLFGFGIGAPTSLSKSETLAALQSMHDLQRSCRQWNMILLSCHLRILCSCRRRTQRSGRCTTCERSCARMIIACNHPWSCLSQNMKRLFFCLQERDSALRSMHDLRAQLRSCADLLEQQQRAAGLARLGRCAGRTVARQSQLAAASSERDVQSCTAASA